VCVFAADIKPYSSLAWQQVTAAAGTDARCNGGATEGCLWTVAGTEWQFRGHVDPEVQHAVAVFLMVLRVFLLLLLQYLITSSVLCLCMCVVCLSVHVCRVLVVVECQLQMAKSSKFWLLSSIHWKYFSLVDIDVPSAVEVFTTLRYINVHLLTYLLFTCLLESTWQFSPFSQALDTGGKLFLLHSNDGP